MTSTISTRIHRGFNSQVPVRVSLGGRGSLSPAWSRFPLQGEDSSHRGWDALHPTVISLDWIFVNELLNCGMSDAYNYNMYVRVVKHKNKIKTTCPPPSLRNTSLACRCFPWTRCPTSAHQGNRCPEVSCSFSCGRTCRLSPGFCCQRHAAGNILEHVSWGMWTRISPA